MGNQQKIKRASKNVKETTVFKKAFELAMEIFKISKKIPKEETYSLTDQVRRSSRSVCICLNEAYRKKRYPAHFVSKVTDSDMENSETSGWLDFSKACEYITHEQYLLLSAKNEEIGKLLNHMINNPDNINVSIAYCLLSIANF
ncbi:MAG TPA: four helix bundle protein [Chitinophagaceae bacterium]|nr:four helix bundle protein [Chitinophagaceae bacterium]